MYSVVLMMALTSGAETPALFNRGGCSGCHGCSGYSCSGSCRGSCSGSCHGRRRLFGGRRHSCCGCSGSYACHGGCRGYSCCGAVAACTGACYGGACQGAAPAPMPAKPAGKPPEKVKKPPEEKEETMAPAPATIIVSLPADAKLTVDDVATVSTSANRAFATPALLQGKVYTYTLKAEVVREGKAVVVAKKVDVRAGQASQVSFELPVESVASK